METLTEKVYECTLAVEAHMICDLLARGGVSARVDGAFLAGAGGELPLGNTVKVRVDPARATEAREIISDWEKLQPPEPALPRKRSPLRSPLWFVAGVLVGGGIIYLAFNSPIRESGADFNGDGIDEETYHYRGTTLRSVDLDRNGDGKVDARWTNDIRGVPDGYTADDDFDGRFEWVHELRQGQVVAYTLDENGDGRPDMVTHLKHGVVRSVDIHDQQGGRIVARQTFENGWKTSADFDLDGDGIFERHVAYDRFGDPR
jgi:hypothetical protein